MTYPTFSFTGTSSAPNQTAQAGLNQYIQQGQIALSPGQTQLAASNPVASAGHAMLGQALQQAANTPVPGSDVAQAAMGFGAQANPNVNGQNMGGVGPTPQNLALAQGLMNPQPTNATQQFLNPNAQ